MPNTFKKVIDQLMWRQVAPAPTLHGIGVSLASDLRSDSSRHPFVYQLGSATVLNRFNIVTKGWSFVQSPALAGSFAAGAALAFAPSLGLVGVLAAGSTTTSVVVSTAFPTAVGVNMLANRGGSGDMGFKLRITDAGAGKTEERWIVGNTAGTTPTITVGAAFTFTPSTGARYEILSGRVFMLNAGALAANIWRSLEVAANTLSTGLTTTNLPATIGTDSSFMVLDEQYTPFNMKPGEGMVKGAFTYDTGLTSLTATAAGASTLTGQASLGDAFVAANEFRNFQIRIVQDTVTPAAVGQRRIIASHTAGPSPVYTLGSAWTTQPSASAKYVIELPNLILLRSSAQTAVYTYNYGDAAVNNGTNSIAAGAWSSTYFGAAPAGGAAGGLWAPSFGIQPDPARNARHSFCYFFRGGGVATLDVLDIAGSITGTWTGAITYDASGSALINTGSCGAYSPFGSEGRMFYLNAYVASQVNQIYRFDVQNRVLSPYAPTDFLQAGTAALGNRMAAYAAIDGADLYDVVLLQAHASTVAQELVVLV
ncbi:hypothetical protein [Phenylobacterium sp.]|uniref:hypothetical protein n=1 Tax=Phenylobacterium sp. TaxID=1871053 RepID=UPI0025D69E89|nr:hypothetical protein [Phenylobacterium sp.]MCA6343479.1 hypothetical protein [Phenylobacterium sp.]